MTLNSRLLLLVSALSLALQLNVRAAARPLPTEDRERTANFDTQDPAVMFSLDRIPFQAPDEGEAERNRLQFEAAVKRLAHRLAEAGDEYYLGWSNYLHFDPIVDAVSRGVEPRLEDIRVFRRWLFSNQPGIEDRLFHDVRVAVLPYEATRFTHEMRSLEEVHHQQLLSLMAAWSDYRQDPSVRNELKIQGILHWFSMTKTDGGRLDEAVKAQLQPNLCIQVSDHLIRQWAAPRLNNYQNHRSVSTNFTLPINPVGTPTPISATGEANTAGTVDFTLLPSANSLLVNLRFHGNTEAMTSSSMNRLTIETRMAGKLSSSGTIEIRPEELDIRNVVGQAELERLGFEFRTGHRSELVGEFIEGFADNLVSSQRVQSSLRSQVIKHFEEEIASQFQSEIRGLASQTEHLQVADVLSSGNESIARVVAPLIREGVEIKLDSLRSGSDAIQAGFCLRSKGGLTTCDLPPMTEHEGIQIAVHESFVNNLFTQMWGGKWLSDVYLERASRLIYSNAPYELYTHDRKERWRIQLAEHMPFVFAWTSAGEMQASLRVQAFQYRSTELSECRTVVAPMIYTATYRIHENEFGEIALQRTSFESILESEPSEMYVSTESIPGQELVEADREFLDRQADRMQAWLGEDIDFGGLVVPEGGELSEKLNQFMVNGWEMQDGWLTARLSKRKDL